MRRGTETRKRLLIASRFQSFFLFQGKPWSGTLLLDLFLRPDCKQGIKDSPRGGGDSGSYERPLIFKMCFQIFKKQQPITRYQNGQIKLSFDIFWVN